MRRGDFAGLTGVRRLSFFDQPLTSLPAGVFDGLTSLRSLNLERGQLASLSPGVFDPLRGLTELVLSNNRLSSLGSGVFDGLTALEWLDLRHNQLQSVPLAELEKLPALTRLLTQNNPGTRYRVEVSPPAVTVEQGGTTSYRVRLMRPGVWVVGTTSQGSTVRPTPPSESAGVTVTPERLTFVPANWFRSREVTVVAAGDATLGPVRIAHRASGKFSPDAPAVRVQVVPATAPATEEATAEDAPATIAGAPVVSDPGTDGAWTPGEAVEVTLTFSEAVTVTTGGGTPAIGLQLNGTAPRAAVYDRGSRTGSLVFRYPVAAADGTVSSVIVPPNALVLNGGAIDGATGVAADRSHVGAARAGSPVIEAPVRDPLTAAFEDMPASHDGTAFTFQVRFSADVGLSYTTLRDAAFTVTAGAVTRARRVDGSHRLWTITVAPDAREAVTLTLPGHRDCGTTGAVCTRGDDPRPLSHSPSATVEGPPAEPLTARFSDMPAEHTGDAFTFGLTFSEEPDLSYQTVRDEALDASGGTVRKARRTQQGSNQAWAITVEPEGDGAVSLSLPATTSCGARGAICTGDGRPLSHALSARVAGPVGIAVADARVDENDGAQLAFVVTLSRAASGTLTVDYATADGSAQAGVDYTAVRGTLTFRAGERSKTIEVTVLDDVIDEGEETLTLTLSHASGGRLTDAEATGTIVNRDPLPRALLARFGRTAAVHVVEHVEERMAAPRQPGFEGRVAGRQLRRGMEREMALEFLNRLGGAAGMHAPGGGVRSPMAGSGVAGVGALGTPGLGGGGLGMPGAAGAMGAPNAGMMSIGAGAMGAAAGPDGGLLGGGLSALGLGGDSLLTGSSFALNRETQGGVLSVWSRGARSHFSGREGALSLGGDVRTTMVGADYATGPMVMGLSLSRSRGLGEYTGAAGGQVASSVTGLYPWLGYKATDRITVWGVAGYGAGGMRLTPDGAPALESGLSMAMAAAGTRGELVAGGASGFALAFKADALWVGTASDGVDGPAGRLAATAAAVTRFRTGLEGSRAYTLAGRLSLTPSVEVGLRHDGGDAETGAGMDIGGGLIVSDASTGLAVDVRVRMLLVHQAEGFRERGVSLSLSYTPTPSTPLGFTARVAPSWGGQATSGAQALWGRETMAGMAGGGSAQGNRLDGEVGYGLPVGSRLVGTPRVGFSTSEYGREYRLGYGLGVLDRESLNVELGVDAHRRESPMLDATDNGFLGRATLGW